MTTFGYAKISTDGQKVAAQTEALHTALAVQQLNGSQKQEIGAL
jgi:hypothetical protein